MLPRLGEKAFSPHDPSKSTCHHSSVIYALARPDVHRLTNPWYQIESGRKGGSSMLGNRRDTWPRPPPGRIILAFIAAPAASSAVSACVFQSDFGASWAARFLSAFLPIFLLGALPMTVVIGIPLFLVLRVLVRPTILACGITGAAVIGLPTLALIVDYCFPSTATVGQLADLVRKYLEDNPASRADRAGDLISMAFLTAFGCNESDY